MLIDAFLSDEKGLDNSDETGLNQPDENHNHHESKYCHRHEECLKPYNPKIARRSTSRGPALKTSVIRSSRLRSANNHDMYSQGSPATRLFTTDMADDNLTEDVSVIMSDGPDRVPAGTNPANTRTNNGGAMIAPVSRTNNGGLGGAKYNLSDARRQGSSVPKPPRPTQSWKAGKPAMDLVPVEPKNISKDIPTKTWKAVRFAATCSRGSNTVSSINVTKGVQTVSTAYKLRLNRWPVWGTSLDYYGGGQSPSTSKEESYHYPLWIRRILSIVFSQFGIVLFLTSWITGHAALFQHLEQQPDVKLVNDVVSSRNELVITLATELRQVFPYEMAWRRKIDDYFIKFEATLNNATARGYSTQRRAFYKWDYLDFLLFSFQLVTGQGYGTDVPKTEWSLLLSIPCVLIGMPFMWLFLIDLGAKWADTLSNSIQKFRWNLARRYPDVVSLQTENAYLPPPPPPHLHQNGLERFSEEVSIVRPYQNGNGGRIPMLANGDAHDARFYSQNTEPNSPTLRSVWTVEPVTVAMMPAAPPKAAKLSTLPADEVYHHATPWVATIFTVLYPFLGTLIFGLWAEQPLTTSFVLPFTSLMFISPPAVSTTFLWRALFHVYLLIGWILVIACFLLWHQSWRDIIRNWAHDLSIKHYQKTYPLQVR